jgi:hypothetical protein
LPDASIYRTWDDDLREARRLLLIDRARIVSDAVAGTPFAVAVTGSLSRGQVHPWSDLDLLMFRRVGEEKLGEEGRKLRADILFGVDFHDLDLVPMEHVPPALAEGMLGSAVAVDDVPDLDELPDPRLSITRTAMSMRFALEQSRSVDLGRLDKNRRGRPSETDRLIAFAAFRDLYAKAGLWAKRLLVFQDGGRSAWLDDHDEEDALEEALIRLASPAEAPFQRPAVFDEDDAHTLGFLVLGASDYGYEEGQNVVKALRNTRWNLDQLVEGLYALEMDHSTHGLKI